MNLISPAEVIKYSDLDVNFSVASLRQISQLESFVFGTKFNSDLYLDLLAALNDWSDKPTWKADLVVLVNDVVQYNGIYYKALDTATGILPTNNIKYQPAPKFDSECFEDFWCEVLANYLALVVVENRLPRIALKIKTEGIIKMKGDNFDGANKGDLLMITNSLLRDIEIVLYNLQEYIDNTACMSKYRSQVSCNSRGNTIKKAEYNVG